MGVYSHSFRSVQYGLVWVEMDKGSGLLFIFSNLKFLGRPKPVPRNTGGLWIIGRVFFVYGALLTCLKDWAFIQYLVSDLGVSKLVKTSASLDERGFIYVG